MLFRSRFEEIKHQTDSIFGYISGFGWTFAQETIDSTKKYTWWANSVGFPLVETTMDWTTGNVSRATWLQALPVTGIYEYTGATEVNTYPNPAQNELNIMLNSAEVARVEIFDIAGRYLKKVEVTGDLTSININDYSNGMYIYQVIGKNNSLLNKGKFTVAK